MGEASAFIETGGVGAWGRDGDETGRGASEKQAPGK